MTATCYFNFYDEGTVLENKHLQLSKFGFDYDCEWDKVVPRYSREGNLRPCAVTIDTETDEEFFSLLQEHLAYLSEKYNRDIEVFVDGAHRPSFRYWGVWKRNAENSVPETKSETESNT